MKISLRFFLIVSIFFYSRSSISQCIPETPSNPTTISGSGMGGRTITYTNISLNGGTNFAEVEPGANFTVSFDYNTSPTITSCPGCITFLYFGLAGASYYDNDASPRQNTESVGTISPNSTGSPNTTFIAPDEPGYYYITTNTSWTYWAYQFRVNHTNCENRNIGLIKVGNPTSLAISNSSVINATSCNGSDGSIDIDVTGGLGGCQYLWSNGETTQDISNLPAGSYSVTIKDNNCTETQNFIITDPDPPIIDTPTNIAACDSFQLPEITGSNLVSPAYYTGPNKTGTTYNEGDLIYTSSTLYIYDETSTARTLINLGDEFKYFIPTSEPNSNWSDLSFDDSSWSLGLSGFGSGDGDDATIITPVPQSIYLRKTFTINNLASISSLFLDMDYDDAFVAYINGNEVARANINGAPPAYNSGTIRSHEAQIYSGGSPERFMITDFNSILNEGENILTIQAHNQSANSSDFTIIPFLSAIVDNSTTGIEPPAILDLLPGCIDEESFTITINSTITPTFTQVDPICNGGVLGELPATSNNNITGTWAPALDNTLTTTYTFTPDASQTCAVNQTMTITVNPLITPTFTQVDPICNGDVLGELPTESNNGVTGTWAPAIDNTETTTYTFSPDITQPDQACAVNQTMTITVNPLITPTFTQVAAICNGDDLGELPLTSDNGITGTWAPVINNTATETYTFTPDASQTCAVSQTMTITVNPLITTTFTQVDPICNGEFLAALPTISNNGVTGTWSPVINNTATETYTFTPDITQPDQACAVNQTMTITVNQITPTFTQVDPICNGGVLGELPTTSNNNITGTWSPAINNTATTTYTFTPDASQTCAVDQTMEITITVNPITPTFTQVDPICNGDDLGELPLTSDNGITGTWAPVINNTATETYTFTPDASQTCAVSQTMTITVNPLITPTFTQVDPICNGDVLGELPLTSDNGITGTWAPVINNTATETYTFTPDITQPDQACAVNQTMTITVNPLITPTFTQVDPICNGGVLGELPATSNNNITGTWAPALDNTLTTTYTFTPDASQTCAVNQTMTITVNPLITPTFTQVDPICNGDVLGELPTESNNGVTGTWAPAIDNTATETYTFTPDASQTCAVSQTMTITVNPLITPTFTQVDPICNGDVLGELPTESNNGVTGTWAPAIDNTETTTYTFSPDITQPDQACAVNQTMTITVNPLITPTFTQVDPICNGDVLGELPTESNNGVTGTWAPAIDNTETTTYTFSPDITQPDQACAVNQTMTITVNPVITPTFTQVDPICNGDVLATLPTTSNNGITGTWSPAIDNTATETYTFTPDITQPDQACAVNQTMTITVNPLITPTFTQVDPICNGEFLAALPTISNNGVTGTWSPAIDNTDTETYTFTPDITQPDQACAVNQTMTITVNPLITTTFTQVDPICNGDVLATLPTTSNNGITGTWSPAIDNTATETYTFTPDITQPDQACAVNQTMTITVNPLITPTFTQVDPICNGEFLAALPTISNNGVTGTWSPAIDNTDTETYTFTPDITQPDQACAVNQTMTITVNPLITTTFTQVDPICNGEFLAALPTISNNGVTGTWSPAIDNTLTTTYTFAPDTTQQDQACAVNQTMEITVNPLITPTFTQVDPICNGDVLGELPTESNNGVTGTWAPAIDNTETTTYTFSPDITQPDQACAVNETMTITVNPVITPTFTQVDPICNGEFLATLPTISNNGITGTWSPAIDNTLTTTYTFAPDTTQQDQVCAVNQTMEITVNPLITPTFTQVDPICNGDDLGELPTESNNGITGTWSPDIDNTATETYTFTPDNSETCAVSQTMEITVKSLITPTFTQVDPICNGDTLAALPTTSYNGVTGTWSPAIDNTETTTYTFSPDTSQSNQTCAVSQTMEITVNPLITPTFTQVDPICNGDVLAALPTTSNNGVTGTWSPAINNTLTTTYTFSPDASETCAELMTLEIVVNNIVNSINNIRAKVNMVSSSFGDNQSIEVIASGGNAPYEFRLENGPWQDSPTFNNITDCFYEVFVREKTACNNQPATSVRFINHPVFFTPNNDGFNDIWNVKCLEGKPEAKITIYDRYGRIIDIQRPNSNGWDGLHNGRKMPSNDYWFKFEYLDMENIPRVFRSHFSLIR